jgi:CobQ-like glutamine amidotransferase family enzyme
MSRKKKDLPVTILHLYPHEMNIYGDWGNVLTLIRRLEWHGYTPKLVEHHPGKKFPDKVDIIVGGGGQDSGQAAVQGDLLAIAPQLRELAEEHVPMLVICGLYQLFGRFFRTAEGRTIKGIGIFKAETHGGPTRLIGNTVVSSPFGDLIGYENHSGLTLLDDNQAAFGHIIKGKGNNGTDGTEGAVYKNVFGTYLHGSLLPKNPDFADALLEAAVLHAGMPFDPMVIDDTFAGYAREVARRRPR